MPRLGVWIGLLVALMSASPALAKDGAISYGQTTEILVQSFPLTISVAGTHEPPISHAWQQLGRVEGHPTLTVKRLQGMFAFDLYFGRITLFEAESDRLRRPLPTPRASIGQWRFFSDKQPTFGESATVTNGRMEIRYALATLDDRDAKTCALFTGEADIWEIEGYVCTPQAGTLASMTPRLLRALGGLPPLAPEPLALSANRDSGSADRHAIVASEPFNPRTVPFVSDAGREELRGYLKEPLPKALAVHGSGAVGWASGQSSETEAIRRAMERCAFQARARCVLYAVGNRVVFHDDALAQEPAATAPPSTPSSAPGGQATPLSNAQLVAYLETATALIVATQKRGASVGSGFFVSPDRLLTNRHVVKGAERVLVTSRTLGKPYPARVVARTDRGAIGGADYALLEVPGIAHAPLNFTTEVAKLQEVIAAGYPGVTIANDADFRAFAQGQASAAPDLVITRGEVNAIQINQSRVPTIAHTALISEGNSGGPLVDRCGRVVGINSYIAQKTTVTGFAIASSDLVEFLGRNGVRTAVNNTACATGAAVQR